MSLAERAEKLPTGPGVYLFKSDRGRVLYVGKAQNLRARVRQYVAGGDGRIRIPRLIERAVDVDVVERVWGDWTITQRSHRYKDLDSRTIEFPVHLDPDESEEVTYTIRFRSC